MKKLLLLSLGFVIVSISGCDHYTAQLKEMLNPTENPKQYAAIGFVDPNAIEPASGDQSMAMSSSVETYPFSYFLSQEYLKRAHVEPVSYTHLTLPTTVIV